MIKWNKLPWGKITIGCFIIILLLSFQNQISKNRQHIERNSIRVTKLETESIENTFRQLNFVIQDIKSLKVIIENKDHIIRNKTDIDILENEVFRRRK